MRDTIKRTAAMGRPKQTEEERLRKQAERALAKEDFSKVPKEVLDNLLLEQLTGIMARSVKGLDEAFMACNDPQKKTAAMINLRSLMDDIKGGATGGVKKEMSKIVTDLKGNVLTREQQISLARQGRGATEILGIAKKKLDKSGGSDV